MNTTFPLRGVLFGLMILSVFSCQPKIIPWYMVPPAAPLLIVPDDYSLLPPEEISLSQGKTIAFPNTLPSVAVQARRIIWGVVFNEPSKNSKLSKTQLQWLSRAGKIQPKIRSLLFKKSSNKQSSNNSEDPSNVSKFVP